MAAAYIEALRMDRDEFRREMIEARFSGWPYERALRNLIACNRALAAADVDPLEEAS